MTDVPRRATVEEFYARCLAHSTTLDSAARAFAAHGESMDAVACAWGADLAAAQAVLWERIVLGSPTPVRRYYQAGEVMIRALSERHEVDSEYPDTSAEHVVVGARRRMLRAFDQRLARAVEARMPSVAYLGAMTAPTAADITASVSRRLMGLTARSFVEGRRGDAADAMRDAYELRDAGELGAAVRRAYDADAWSLAAYLVESAVAVGDDALMTVTTRWELVNAGIEALAALPSDFDAAVHVLRSTVMRELGEADGLRWRATLAA